MIWKSENIQTLEIKRPGIKIIVTKTNNKLMRISIIIYGITYNSDKCFDVVGENACNQFLSMINEINTYLMKG